MSNKLHVPENLKGKVVYIGKDAGCGRLLISMSIGGKKANALLGEQNSVPKSVSRCVPDEGVAHLSISVNDEGVITAKNLKSQNVTYVEGTEIVSKILLNDAEIELGLDKYPIKLSSILSVAEKIVEASEPTKIPEFNISHLEDVWNNYHNNCIELQKRTRKQNVQGRIPMFFTMGAGALSSIAFACGWGDEVKIICVILTVIGLLLMGYTFLKSKNDTSIEDRERFTDEFQENYICPNPKCGKYLGSYSYKLMKRQYSMSCPHCKCKFVEK